MKHIKEYNSFKDIDAICQRYGITNYTINNGLVDVESVNLASRKLTKLPLQFGKVTGNFFCGNNQLTTLEGAPKWVGGGFYCSFNPLPKEIYTYRKYIKEIIKWQDDYNIWRDGKIDPFRFGELIKDIEDETY